jgi:hypothetical protein
MAASWNLASPRIRLCGGKPQVSITNKMGVVCDEATRMRLIKQREELLAILSGQKARCRESLTPRARRFTLKFQHHSRRKMRQLAGCKNLRTRKTVVKDKAYEIEPVIPYGAWLVNERLY